MYSDYRIKSKGKFLNLFNFLPSNFPVFLDFNKLPWMLKSCPQDICLIVSNKGYMELFRI